jgi:hypothetical protein
MLASFHFCGLGSKKLNYCKTSAIRLLRCKSKEFYRIAILNGQNTAATCAKAQPD